MLVYYIATALQKLVYYTMQFIERGPLYFMGITLSFPVHTCTHTHTHTLILPRVPMVQLVCLACVVRTVHSEMMGRLDPLGTQDLWELQEKREVLERRA